MGSIDGYYLRHTGISIDQFIKNNRSRHSLLSDKQLRQQTQDASAQNLTLPIMATTGAEHVLRLIRHSHRR
jgi:hypothetical protein